MNKNLALYKFDACPFCQMVMNHIKNLNLNIPMVDILEDQEALEKHIAKTGKRTVPCLYIDGNPLFESSDIIDWLDKNQSDLK